jgi:hypothetical protein
LGLRGTTGLKGRRAADLIVGGKGVDEMYGLGGDDLICGGFGYEVIPNDEVGEVVVGDRSSPGRVTIGFEEIPIGRHRHHSVALHHPV